MKRIKNLTAILLASLIVLSLAACGTADKKPLKSGNITKDNVADVCEILKGAGLFNVDVFKNWVLKFSDTATDEDAQSGFSDPDCRMTVMLLAGDGFKYKSTLKDYNGTYLMFDTDAIENNKDYSILKEKEALFTTVFGEMPFSGTGFADALKNRWDEHSITFENPNCSVISLVMKAYEADEAFVGHTGLLIDCKGDENTASNYVFIEKIAFGEPFKITLLKDENELIDMLSKRSEYTAEDGDPAPVLYKNNEQIGELKQ